MASKRTPFKFDLRRPQRTGYMLKQGRLHKLFKRRFFVLYPGFLVWYEDDLKWKGDLARGDTLGSRVGAVYLKGASCNTAKNAPKGCRYGFAIQASDPRNTRQYYVINASDKRDREMWIENIRLCSPTGHTPSSSPQVQRTSHSQDQKLAPPHPVVAMRQETVDSAALVGSTEEKEEEQISDFSEKVPELKVRHDTQNAASLIGPAEHESEETTSFDDALLNRILSRDEGQNSSESEEENKGTELEDHIDVIENGVTENGENGVIENGVTENGITENGITENGIHHEHEAKVEGSEKQASDESAASAVASSEKQEACDESKEVVCNSTVKSNKDGEIEVSVSVTIFPDGTHSVSETLSESPTSSNEGDSEATNGHTAEAEPEVGAENEVQATEATPVEEQTESQQAESVPSEKKTPELENIETPKSEREPEIQSSEATQLNSEASPTIEASTDEAKSEQGSDLEEEHEDQSTGSSSDSSSSDEAEKSPEVASSISPTPVIMVNKANTLKNQPNALKNQSNTAAEENHSEDDDALPEGLTIARPRRRSSLPFIEKRGFLYKCGGKRKSWKLRYFVLQPGAFSYHKNSPNTKPIGTVKLKNMQIFYPGVGERKQSYQFTVHTESSWNSRMDWVIAAVNEKEMKEWVEAFKSAGALDREDD